MENRMNKVKAKKEARENKKTWGELRDIILNASKTGMSKVNKSLTREQVSGIFMDMINEKDLTDIPDGECFNSRRDCFQISSAGLGIMNILREFG